ncbi:hypothetical protein Hanom_Chr07g00652391 [Helianthus anomalus]
MKFLRHCVVLVMLSYSSLDNLLGIFWDLLSFFFFVMIIFKSKYIFVCVRLCPCAFMNVRFALETRLNVFQTAYD